MFEQVEVHVERMLARVSEAERKRNPVLTKFEKRMKRVLTQLKELAAASKPRTETVHEEEKCGE